MQIYIYIAYTYFQLCIRMAPLVYVKCPVFISRTLWWMGWDRMVLDGMVWDRRDVKWSGVSTRRLNAWLDLVLLLLITILVAIMLAQWDMLGLGHSCLKKRARNDGQNEMCAF